MGESVPINARQPFVDLTSKTDEQLLEPAMRAAQAPRPTVALEELSGATALRLAEMQGDTRRRGHVKAAQEARETHLNSSSGNGPRNRLETARVSWARTRAKPRLGPVTSEWTSV